MKLATYPHTLSRISSWRGNYLSTGTTLHVTSFTLPFTDYLQTVSKQTDTWNYEQHSIRDRQPLLGDRRLQDYREGIDLRLTL
jgi:hypothetical protein